MLFDEHRKQSSMCCVHTVRACQKIAQVAPLQIPSLSGLKIERMHGLAAACILAVHPFQVIKTTQGRFNIFH